MADISWLIRRLKAMSIPEVLWRFSQKAEEKREKGRFEKTALPVTAKLFDGKYAAFSAHPEKLYLNRENSSFSTNTAIHLLSGASYKAYRTRWNAGFQTGACWPDTFSYELAYKQRDEIGDARTNWELNRHFQFALLAKDYAATGERAYLDELEALFSDWNAKNPFLHGICWTSVMEVAIRCINWVYAYAFLAGTKAPEGLLNELRIGILNMTDYVSRHYSRYSSANNHLIVEACAIAHSGFLFDHQPWVTLAVEILTEELPKQNYGDGVNKELSLHYQSFYMEAMGLVQRLLLKSGQAVPASWAEMLGKMSRYVADCQGEYGETVVFGDDDEGKVLDLAGVSGEKEHANHYRYVLGMMSLLLNEQFVELKALESENLRWLFTEEEWRAAGEKHLYQSPQYRCYREGGNTILRSADRKLLIGIDHAALGFGSICAHAHADALSFQLFCEGKPVLVDPGTYIYHCDLPSRNAFRETRNHNTVCVDGKNQSQMLGAFLWGAKAETKLLSAREEGGGYVLEAAHDGYGSPTTRRFAFDGNAVLEIDDTVPGGAHTASFLLGPGFSVRQAAGQWIVSDGAICLRMEYRAEGALQVETEECVYSTQYGVKEQITALRVSFSGNTLHTRLVIGAEASR